MPQEVNGISTGKNEGRFLDEKKELHGVTERFLRRKYCLIVIPNFQYVLSEEKPATRIFTNHEILVWGVLPVSKKLSNPEYSSLM